ncbi:MAG: hypothetical protein ACPGRH_08780, partial [Alphaproteobacteria bacterium]
MGEIPGSTLCAQPSERTQLLLFGVISYGLTKHSLTIRNIRGTIVLIKRMHGLKKFASIPDLSQNMFASLR